MSTATALEVGLPAEAVYGLDDWLASAATADPLTLSSTRRIWNQRLAWPVKSEESCTAHAIAAAMETRMVVTGMIGTDDEPLDPIALFVRAGRSRDAFLCSDIAVKGIQSGIHTIKADMEYLGDVSPADITGRLVKNQPMVSEIEVRPDLADYRGGIYTPRTGSIAYHAVCIVGHGTDPDTRLPYWLAKNSYGAEWGESGYMKLAWRGPTKPEMFIHLLRNVTR
ncbi:C1 family peptidase [Gemmatimonas sp.]|uniref:C1 family peptidase n=1 Tax=Gemmatimonas sp. TaxID=1962908 RepID=UPI003F71B900